LSASNASFAKEVQFFQRAAFRVILEMNAMRFCDDQRGVGQGGNLLRHRPELPVG
jgi:hypothetical protein